MEITAVPVEHEAALREWYDVLLAAAAADSPGVPVMTFPEVLEKARGGATVEREDYWVGRRDGRAVGAYRLRAPQRDNLDTTELLLTVRPEDRRRGAGAALVAHALDQLRAMGRHRMMTQVAEAADGAPGPGARLAAAAGFRPALAETRRVLDLTTLDEGRLEQIEQEARAHAGGYGLVSWTGSCPDEHVEAYAGLIGRMLTDAPLDDLDLEPEVWDVDRIREREVLMAAQLRTQLMTAARHLGGGELVAYTDIVVTTHDPANAYQWDTLVRPDHRGHRLGMLVKVANLRRLLEQAPAAERVHTWNADSNAHMLAINEAMGFVPLQREVEWQLDLA